MGYLAQALARQQCPVPRMVRKPLSHVGHRVGWGWDGSWD